MSNIIETVTYFVGEKEIDVVITEENGTFVGKAPSDPSMTVVAQSLTEAKESLRIKVQNKAN